MGLFVRSAALALLSLSTQAFAQAGSLDPAGTFLTEDGRAKIRIEHCNADKLCGFVVWMKEPLNDKGQPRTDLKNPDPAKRSRPSLGLELMSNLKPEDPTHYTGEIYNADDGKMYSVTLAVETPTQLHIKGCMLHFLCGSQTWERVADIAVPGEATKVVSTKAAPKGTPSTAHLHDNQPKR